MATFIRLDREITDTTAPRIRETITSDDFAGSGDIVTTNAALGGVPYPVTNVSGAWSRHDGGITSSGGSYNIDGLPNDLAVAFTVRKLHPAGRMMLSLRSDTFNGSNREVLEINFDGAVRLNPRVNGVQAAKPYSAAGVVKDGSRVTFMVRGNTVEVFVDGETITQGAASIPSGSFFTLSSYQMTAGVLLDDLVITTA